jgi:hypothetical protein
MRLLLIVLLLAGCAGLPEKPELERRADFAKWFRSFEGTITVTRYDK